MEQAVYYFFSKEEVHGYFTYFGIDLYKYHSVAAPEGYYIIVRKLAYPLPAVVGQSASSLADGTHLPPIQMTAPRMADSSHVVVGVMEEAREEVGSLGLRV